MSSNPVRHVTTPGLADEGRLRLLETFVGRPHAVPDCVHLIADRALPLLVDDPPHRAENGVGGLAGLEPLRVVEPERPIRHVVVLEPAPDGLPNARHGDIGAEERIDQGALPDTGLAEDREVHGAERRESVLEHATEIMVVSATHRVPSASR